MCNTPLVFIFANRLLVKIGSIRRPSGWSTLGHSDPNTLSRHYMPTNGRGEQNTYLGDQGQTIIFDLFGGRSVARNPTPWQCLSAEKQDELGNTEECRALKEEISALEGATNKKSAVERRCTRRNTTCSTMRSTTSKGTKQTGTATDPDTTGRYSIGSGF
jgi:hypothetical protein